MTISEKLKRIKGLLRLKFKLSKAIKYVKSDRYDIGLTGCWAVENYGGALTYYALYCVLSEMGYAVKMIEARSGNKNYTTPAQKLFRKNPYPVYDISPIQHSFEEQAALNQKIGCFILGSDQVWNAALFTPELIRSYSMDYVSDDNKRIAYATSFGSVIFNGNNEVKAEMEKLLKKFDHISVRERSGVAICSNDFECEAVAVLDPVFLCDKRCFLDIADPIPKEKEGKYLFTYFLWPTRYTLGIDKVAEKFGMEYKNTVNASKKSLDRVNFGSGNWPYEYEKDCAEERWLGLLINSELILTDSFHATCLAIKFNKQFVYVKGHINEENGLERITSLLDTLELGQRIANNVQEVLTNDIFSEKIDYARVNKILEREILKSRLWLSTSILSEKGRQDKKEKAHG